MELLSTEHPVLIRAFLLSIAPWTANQKPDAGPTRAKLF